MDESEGARIGLTEWLEYADGTVISTGVQVLRGQINFPQHLTSEGMTRGGRCKSKRNRS